MAHKPNIITTTALNDPNVYTVSLTIAAGLLGIAKSTATTAVRATGELTPGVPVMRVGRRCLVSTRHLRTVLGIPEPTVN
jgi:hypothetical protein